MHAWNTRNLKLHFCLGRHKYPFSYHIFEFQIISVAGEGDFILDAGCGFNSPILGLQHFAFAVVLDIERLNLRKLASKCNKCDLNRISFIVASVNNLPFRENVFDVVAMRDVLEHIDDIDRSLQEMAYSMKNRAKIIITTTNFLNPIMLCDSMLPGVVSQKIINRFGVSYYERKTRLNPFSMVRLLTKNSLIVKRLLMFSIPPFVTLKKLSIYEYAFPKIYYFWIAFEKLTNTIITKIFKEIIFVIAEKTSHMSRMHDT